VAAVGTRRRTLEGWLERHRRRTRKLVDPLADDDMHRQHHAIMSPVVWDVGHVANFEEWWLLRELAGRPSTDPDLDVLYDPVVNPRAGRGGLALPERREAIAYLDAVRAEAVEVMRATTFDPDEPLRRDGYVFSMVAQHEAQHQETILAALDLRADLDPYPPAALLASHRVLGRSVDDEARVAVPAGAFVMGTDDTADAYDNERPGHLVDVGDFWIDRFPVTGRRFAAFIADGGYARAELWSDGGRAWLADTGHGAPQGWVPDGAGGWGIRRFGHLVPLDPFEPVVHVSYWEAQAFAHWVGGRLPTEAEWEKAVRWDPVGGRSRPYPWGDAPPTPRHANVDVARFGPAPVGSLPAGASAYGVEHAVGDVYEWTASEFTAYPGFSCFPYPEYSEVFFDEGYRVLRGASWATSAAVARASFRNWDHPQRRQIFSGIRVAYGGDRGRP
jgi:iron(II)-dependent oxidoreductase